MWRMPHLLWRLHLLTLLLKSTIGTDTLLEVNKRQNLIPAARLGRTALLTVLDDRGKPQSMMPFPRLGRTVLELSDRPRASRFVTFSVPPGPNDDYGPAVWDDEVLEADPDHDLEKRPKLIPRIGRRKRSTSGAGDDQCGGAGRFGEAEDDDGKKRSSESAWDREEKRAQFIPRVGRSGGEGSRLRYRHRGIFIPRVGRRST